MNILFVVLFAGAVFCLVFGMCDIEWAVEHKDSQIASRGGLLAMAAIILIAVVWWA